MKLKVYFEFVIPHNEYESLPNYGAREISQLLISEMSSFNSITTKDLGLWKDFGHLFQCTHKQNNFLIFIAKYFPDEPWQLLSN